MGDATVLEIKDALGGAENAGKMRPVADFIEWWLVISLRKYSPRQKEELYLKKRPITERMH